MEPSKFIDWNVLDRFLGAYAKELHDEPESDDRIETINTIKQASECFAFEENEDE